MTASAPIETYNQIEANFLEHNTSTKAFYHDLIHKKLHLEYPEGSDPRQIEQLRKASALNDVEFSLREEVKSSYPFPPYERVEENGQLRLKAEGLGYIDEMFDPDGPRAEHWPAARKDPDSINYKRATTEHKTIVDFQNSDAFRQAKPGETFIWTSPSVYDIHLNPHLNLEEKKALLDQVCYGFHSFIFTYTVLENGDLQPQVHTTYFNPHGLKQLYAQVYGQEKLAEFPADEQLDMHLLGKIEKLPHTSEQLKEVIKSVEALPNTQFELPEDVKTAEVEVRQVDQALQDARPLAEYYYFLQRYATARDLGDINIQQLIDSAFQTWRKTAYSRLGGGDPQELVFFRDLQADALEGLARAQIQEARRLSRPSWRSMGDQVFMPDVPVHIRAAAFHMDQLAARMPNVAAVATGCGIGSGFSGGEGTSSLTGFTTTYEGASAMLAGSSAFPSTEKKSGVRKEKIGCPECTKKNGGKRVEVIALIGNGHITCTKCKATAPYKC